MRAHGALGSFGSLGVKIQIEKDSPNLVLPIGFLVVPFYGL